MHDQTGRHQVYVYDKMAKDNDTKVENYKNKQKF